MNFSIELPPGDTDLAVVAPGENGGIPHAPEDRCANWLLCGLVDGDGARVTSAELSADFTMWRSIGGYGICEQAADDQLSGVYDGTGRVLAVPGVHAFSRSDDGNLLGYLLVDRPCSFTPPSCRARVFVGDGTAGNATEVSESYSLILYHLRWNPGDRAFAYWGFSGLDRDIMLVGADRIERGYYIFRLREEMARRTGVDSMQSDFALKPF